MNFRDFFSFQKRIYFKLVGFILFVAFLSSCQDCTFESDNITFARVQFHHRATKEAFDKEALDSAFISVRAINDLANVDQVFEGRATINPNDVDTEANQTLTYNLPLYTSDIRSTFIFAHDDAAQTQDTLTFSYQLHLDVSTPDCGVNERIDSLKIFSTTFDSAVVIHTTIDLNNNHDVEIYLPF
jgi:hypothetical protein